MNGVAPAEGCGSMNWITRGSSTRATRYALVLTASALVRKKALVPGALDRGLVVLDL